MLGWVVKIGQVHLRRATGPTAAPAATVGRSAALSRRLRALQTLYSERRHVELQGKLKAALVFEALHGFVVKFEALQLDAQSVGQALDALALHCVHFAPALLAHVLVLSLHELPRHVGRQRLGQVLLVADIHRDGKEGLFACGPVLRALSAQHLVHQLPSHHSLHGAPHWRRHRRRLCVHRVLCGRPGSGGVGVGVGCCRDSALELRVYHILQPGEKLEAVLMLAQVDGLPVVVLECPPEPPGSVVVHVAACERREHRLELIKHAISALLLRLRSTRHRQHRASQPGLHVQLLEDRVHVARSARVLQAHVPPRGARRAAGELVPLVDVHTTAVVQAEQRLCHLQHVIGVVRGEVGQELKRGLARGGSGAHRLEVLLQHLHVRVDAADAGPTACAQAAPALCGGVPVPGDNGHVVVLALPVLLAALLLLCDVAAAAAEPSRMPPAPPPACVCVSIAVACACVPPPNHRRRHTRQPQHLCLRSQHGHRLGKQTPEHEHLDQAEPRGSAPHGAALQTFHQAFD
mmetsp:Transcript_12308/g.29801  ORF Transcript_12308/g.29801 Transcript_12308/m.29801 type:complete len:520 (-) Transcript_12308:808-2367(-)